MVLGQAQLKLNLISGGKVSAQGSIGPGSDVFAKFLDVFAKFLVDDGADFFFSNGCEKNI